MAAVDCRVTERNADAELDADLLTMNTNRVSLGNIPEDFISFILKKPGDFCISTNSFASYVLSIQSDKDKIFHLTLENTEDGFRIRSMLFATGTTIGELIYNIRDSSLDVLSGVLGCPVYPRRMITKDVLGRFRIFEAEHIISKKLVNEDSRFKYYESQVLMNGTYTNVLLKGSRRMSPAEWREQMYDELRVSFVARELHLPMRTVHGILRADNGYVIYDNKPGCEFSRFLEEYDDKLDLGTRIKLCRALASVMSGLYNADIYCGAVKLDNFYAYYVGALPYSRIQLVFTGGADLTPLEKTKPIDSGDFSQMAPEVSWTRLLTPEAGVHSMGLVLRRVLGHLPELPTQDPNASLLPRINALISKCLHPRPSERPSMNGIFLELDNAAGSVRHTRQPRWTPI